MNPFVVSKVVAACQHFLMTGNSIYDKAKVAHATNLRDYALAMASDNLQIIMLSVDDFSFLASIYVKIPNTPPCG